jgi:hypothetical protein
MGSRADLRAFGPWCLTAEPGKLPSVCRAAPLPALPGRIGALGYGIALFLKPAILRDRTLSCWQRGRAVVLRLSNLYGDPVLGVRRDSVFTLLLSQRFEIPPSRFSIFWQQRRGVDAVIARRKKIGERDGLRPPRCSFCLIFRQAPRGLALTWRAAIPCRTSQPGQAAGARRRNSARDSRALTSRGY